MGNTLAEKLWNLRILDGERSCAELAAPLLVISQFTLYGDTRKPTPAMLAPIDVMVFDMNSAIRDVKNL